MNNPELPALVTSSGRPGFYFRVLQEGEVGAGDPIVKVGEAEERMTVAEINALLYLPDHSHERLERARRIQPLSPGWRASFEALLRNETSGNAGLVPELAAQPAAPGFRRLVVRSIDEESANVLSLTMQSADAQPLPRAMPGQFVVLRLRPLEQQPPLYRSYSLSGPAWTERYRISVKIEPKGIAGTHLRKHVRTGHVLDVSSPRGTFVLQPSNRPVVLLSAGIGLTPVLSMLYELSASQSPRQVLWVHAALDGAHHPFAEEVHRLILGLPAGRSYVCYSRPDARDKLGKNYDAAGHLGKSTLAQVLPRGADVYLCGPQRFMADMKEVLQTLGVAPERIHVEYFNGGESLTPGVISTTSTAPPHVPTGDVVTGTLVSFARSNVAAHWNASAYRNILELAEACNVPVRWSCRAGVCHNCESGLVSGTVTYQPTPLDRPAEGNVLVCCSRPASDIVLDL